MKLRTAVRTSAIIAVAIGLLAGCRSEPLVSKLPALHGQTRGQVFAKLGTPASDERFKRGTALGEFYGPLENTYPLSNSANANVEIEEMRWLDGDYWISLWLHQIGDSWVVFDSCRWHKGVVF